MAKATPRVERDKLAGAGENQVQTGLIMKARMECPAGTVVRSMTPIDVALAGPAKGAQTTVPRTHM